MLGCHISSFICLSLGAEEWQCSHFPTILLHCAPPNMTSVVALDDINCSAIRLLRRVILINWFIGRLYKRHFTISVTFPIALISTCCVMFTVKISEVVECGHVNTLLLSYVYFGQRECPWSRRLPTISKHLSIIIVNT